MYSSIEDYFDRLIGVTPFRFVTVSEAADLVPCGARATSAAISQELHLT